MSILRRLDGLDDPFYGDELGASDFVKVVTFHRNFVRGLHDHVRTRGGSIANYLTVIDKHASDTKDALRLHLDLWGDFDDRRPN